MAKTIKRLPQSVSNRAKKLLPAAALAFCAIPFLQKAIDPDAKKAQAGSDVAMRNVSGAGVGNEFMLLPLLGFREAAAGLLWVRCDEFFHSGDYDAILPLVRLITWLDPHADNIFITGAWHLAYNFTDSSERSDRRYIAPAQALLDEGIANNPQIPDILFEKGWQNYDKIKDYVAAQDAFQRAIDGPNKEKGTSVLKKEDNTDWPYFSPLKTHHMLAHTLAKRGRIPDAIDQWQKAQVRSSKQMKENSQDYAFKQMNEREIGNARETMQRWRDRYTTTGHDPNINKSNLPNVLNPGVSADKTPRPWDVAFQPHIEMKRPKVFRVYGRFTMADGLRVDVRITDWDYKERPVNPAENTFKVNEDATILVDALSERKTKFERELDMSKDPRMYPFKSQFYKIVLSFNPRSTSPHIQDRFGYSGEGLTDKRKEFVYEDNRDFLRGTKMIEGQGGEGPIWDGKTIPWEQYGQPVRMIRVVYKVSMDQIMGNKPITDADIVPNDQVPPQ